MSTDFLQTLSHVTTLSALLGEGTPSHDPKSSEHTISYLHHDSSQTHLAIFTIMDDGYCLWVNTADGSDDPVIWSKLCVAMVYAAQYDIVVKMDDCGSERELVAQR